MAAFAEYSHRITLLPRITQESQHINDQALHQSEAETFLVQFCLDTVRPRPGFSRKAMFYPVGGGALQSRKSKVKTCSFPVTDSPVAHLDEFLNILTAMKIPVDRRLEILRDIAYISHGMDTLSMRTHYMEVKTMKDIHIDIPSHHHEEEEEDPAIARAKTESMEDKPRLIPAL